MLNFIVLFKICSQCSDNLRVVFDVASEEWLCPLCIHNAHSLFACSTTSKKSFCEFNCGRPISGALSPRRTSYKSCCRLCGVKRRHLNIFEHDEHCNHRYQQRKQNDTYNTNGISLSVLNLLKHKAVYFIIHIITITLHFIHILGIMNKQTMIN